MDWTHIIDRKQHGFLRHIINYTKENVCANNVPQFLSNFKKKNICNFSKTFVILKRIIVNQKELLHSRKRKNIFYHSILLESAVICL